MPRSDRIFRPHTMSGKVIVGSKRKIVGGGGSLLLNMGGPGVGSSYDSLSEYKQITGGRVRPPPPSREVSGVGLGGMIERNLQALALRPEPKSYRKKPQNISFSI